MAEETIGDVLKAMSHNAGRELPHPLYWCFRCRLEAAARTAQDRVLRDTVERWREGGSWITDTMLAALRAEIGVDAD